MQVILQRPYVRCASRSTTEGPPSSTFNLSSRRVLISTSENECTTRTQKPNLWTHEASLSSTLGVDECLANVTVF